MSVDTNDITNFGDLFDYIYKGDKHAYSISMGLLHLIHTWDDLIDKDKEIRDADINAAFLFAITELASSPLWGPGMAMVMKGVYLRWQTANTIEHNKDSTDNDIAMAWMLRIGFYDLFPLIARTLHGDNWGITCSNITAGLYAERLPDFIEEIRNGHK